MTQRRRRVRRVAVAPVVVLSYADDSFELNGVTYHFDPSCRVAGAKVAA